MKRGVLFVVAVFAAVASARAEAPAGACDIGTIKGVRELHEALSRRAVEVVERATHADWMRDARLAALVSDEANTNLGGGDLGRPLGGGVAGVRKLAEAMHADSFRFLGWDYMDGQATPCGPQKVSVEFSDAGSRHVSKVEFAFNAGRVVAAIGWQRSFESGPITQINGAP